MFIGGLIWVSFSAFASAPLIKGGTLLKDAELSAMQFSDGCSISLIGPRVIITAAHCVVYANKKRVFWDGGWFKEIHFGTPRMHPDYKISSGGWKKVGSNQYDIAVATLEKKTTITPFTVEGDVAPQSGERLLIAGAGRPRSEDRPGERRYGYMSLHAKKDFEYELSSAEVVGMLGDSGGVVLKSFDDKEVRLVGVMSMSNLQNRTWAVNLGVKKVQDFLKGFAEDYDVEICGINATCNQVFFNPNGSNSR